MTWKHQHNNNNLKMENLTQQVSSIFIYKSQNNYYNVCYLHNDAVAVTSTATWFWRNKFQPLTPFLMSQAPKVL